MHGAERIKNGDKAIEKRLWRGERCETLRGGEDLVDRLQGHINDMQENTARQRTNKYQKLFENIAIAKYRAVWDEQSGGRTKADASSRGISLRFANINAPHCAVDALPSE